MAKKNDSEDAKSTKNAKSETKTNGKKTNVESENPKSEHADDEKSDSSEKLPADKQAASCSQPADKNHIKLDSDKESINIECPSSDENATKSSDSSQNEEDAYYYIDDVVNKGGYGKFQRNLTFLAGLGWFADGVEVMIMSYLGYYLACEWTLYRWQNVMFTTAMFIGMMVGAPLFGVIADIYGRRMSLGISMLLLFAFGSGSALAQDAVAMFVVRGFMGVALGGIAQSVTICSEYYAAIDRGTAGFYLAYWWAFGTIVLILLSWWIMHSLNSWRWLLFVASLPALIVFLVIKLYPESARYYLVSHQPEKAIKQLEKLARMNKIEMPKGNLKLPEEDEALGRIYDLLKPELRISTLLIWYLWFSSAFSYYAFALITPIIIKNGKLRVPKEQLMGTLGVNSTSNFFESIMPCKPFTQWNYIDLLWTTAAEFPGLFVFSVLVKFMNRKTLLSGSCFLTMLITFLLLVNTNYSIVSNVLVFLGRAIMVSVLQLIFIMTTEAFPTTLRAIAMGTGSGLGRLGAAIVPFAAQLFVISHPIATVCVIGLILFLAALAAAFLPRETKDTNLMEMTEDFYNNLGKNVEQKTDDKVA